MKLIKFFSEPEYDYLGSPEPMKNFIPEWYRKAEATWTDEDGEVNMGLKKCMPYLDTLISGYTLTTPADFYISESEEDGSLKIAWDGPESLGSFIMERPAILGATMPRPAGHHPNHLVWSGVWGVKTPKSYSLLMTHPLNRFDLPFTTTSGIVDSDEFFGNGNIPFFMKAGFTGVIPKGTPICQLIPIKRDKWKMVQNDKGLLRGHGIQSHLVRQPETLYKRIMWHKKEYN